MPRKPRTVSTNYLLPSNSKRMTLDLPYDIQMAIRLRAVKGGVRTGDVVAAAIRQTFKDDIAETAAILAQHEKHHEAQ